MNNLSKWKISSYLAAICMTGVVAGGSNVCVFTTGHGSVYGCKPAPCLKIATNTPLYERMEGDMDINARVILDGTAPAAIEEAAARLRAMGAPARRDEYWKYTDPTALTADAAAASAVVSDAFSGVDALRVGALSLPEQAFGEVETVDGAAFAHGPVWNSGPKAGFVAVLVALPLKVIGARGASCSSKAARRSGPTASMTSKPSRSGI